jgi:hypothetical protein
MPTDNFSLTIPLDASGIEGFSTDQKIKVVAIRQDGKTYEQLVQFTSEGKAEVVFGFTDEPGAVRLMLGPAEATAQEILKTDTLLKEVPARQLRAQHKLMLPILKISPYYWLLWKKWCRTYTIHGRVVCANGRPVPGATVTAYDIDWWFWWTSRQNVGSAMTDENGIFELKFRWCCLFLPPWWWRYRVWDIDPWLIKRIQPYLERNPHIRLGRASNQPSFEVFAPLLEGEGELLKGLISHKDADRIEKLRLRLVEKIPPSPDLERLQIWPWYPWWPWRDCVPDIIFKVTQDVITPGTVILDEGVPQTRWNIANPLNVTLVANSKAWCKPDTHDGEVECLVVSEVCGNPIDSIGGNIGAPAQPAGYLSPAATPPNSTVYTADRPFGGSVVVEKVPNDIVHMDYYEIEYVNEADFTAGCSTWQPLPVGWAVDFYRHWLQILPGVPLIIHSGDVLFNWQEIDGHWVIESREHNEAAGGLAGWDTNRWWIHYRDVLMIIDSSKFSDGAYRFQVVAWQKDAAGNLVKRKVLPFCNTQTAAYLILAFDNRLEPDPSHPTSATHLCTAIHRCVTEPDTDIISVKIGGVDVQPCQVVNLNQNADVVIDFMVTDPLVVRSTCNPAVREDTGAHLAYYLLRATYGESLSVNLLQNATSVVPLTPGAISGWQVGDSCGTYGRALSQGATLPHWEGGKYRLTVPINKAFPEPCCYQLELFAYKRPVVSCDHNLVYWNQSNYMIGVGICP